MISRARVERRLAAMVGYCRLSQRRQGWGPVSDAQMAEGLSLARQAIEAGEDDADALWMGGYVVAVFANYRSTAAAVIRRASMLNQNSAHAWNAKGWVLCFGGESDAAIDAFQHAMGIADTIYRRCADLQLFPNRGRQGRGTPAAPKAACWRAASAASSKSSINSWNNRYQLISAFRCRKTEPSPIAARSMNTNSRGGRMPPSRRISRCTLSATPAP